MVRRLSKPPPKPLMIYDGECGFCVRWIRRWQRRTGVTVDYLPAQDPRIRELFPEIAAEQYQQAVHLLAPDGSVYFGAEAVIRSLAFASRNVWLLRWYERSRTFAQLLEWAYRFVARHRRFFSAVS
jgi:predicted DCC family thiol-disulfide oxidoreductase YuxK